MKTAAQRREDHTAWFDALKAAAKSPAVDAVLDLHTPDNWDDRFPDCNACYVDYGHDQWPCETVNAIADVVALPYFVTVVDASEEPA